jgi:hypothetical protein
MKDRRKNERPKIVAAVAAIAAIAAIAARQARTTLLKVRAQQESNRIIPA